MPGGCDRSDGSGTNNRNGNSLGTAGSWRTIQKTLRASVCRRGRRTGNNTIGPTGPIGPILKNMKSMTGYGKAMVAGDDFSVSVDLKTVNNRVLDLPLRVRSQFPSLEPSIKKRITSRLSRGRVDVTVSMERVAQIAYEINRPLIAGYVSALKQLQQDFDISGELDINVIARIPGGLQPARNG